MEIIDKIILDLKKHRVYNKDLSIIKKSLELIKNPDKADEALKELEISLKNKQTNLLTTFLILSALEKNGLSNLGLALKLLVKYESQVGGPYYSKTNNTIDLETNAVIYYYLSLHQVYLPNLEKLISKNRKTLLINFLLTPRNQKTKEATERDPEVAIIDKIKNKIKGRLKNFPKEFTKLATKKISTIINNNKDRQMSLMPYYFKKSLKNNQLITGDFIFEAGMANIFFWTAFIIYDDFWDEDEAADPKLLPIANLLARHYNCFYTSLFKEDKFFSSLMDNLDAANNWEILSCRAKVKNNIFYIPKKIPDYKNYEAKYQAASGHILGPIAMLKMIEKKISPRELDKVVAYFKNYLIAMQINDDSHDWKEDLERGALSTVTVMLIKNWLKKFPNNKKIHLKNDLKKLESIFWFKTIKEAANQAIYHCHLAEEALNSLKIIKDRTPLQKFIEIPKRIANEALEKQQQSIAILENFNKN